ncbi:hypothetical protein JQX13_10770 [Archangium violaceum]|uniref:hypothetical protein n=1 Tax=Archangium violaceum TaxID=83451 RepID=UPI00193BDE86|nr:hypothetical protein [Archangium violaceum]QRK10525.1 hypothetical protein JQX13_10770 [Archangium violaceum]
MQFTVTDPPPPTQWGYLLGMLLHLAVCTLLVGPPLLLWLRRSRGDARDVLRLTSTTTLPVGRIQRLRELMGWLLPTLGLFISLAGAAAWGCAVLFTDAERTRSNPWWNSESNPFSPMWDASFVAGLVGFYLLIFSVRGSSSSRGVLRVGTRIGRGGRSHRRVRCVS